MKRGKDRRGERDDERRGDKVRQWPRGRRAGKPRWKKKTCKEAASKDSFRAGNVRHFSSEP